MPRSVFIIMGSVSGKSFWENQNTFYDQQLFFVQNLVVKMCYCKKNTVQSDRPTYENIAHALCILDT